MSKFYNLFLDETKFNLNGKFLYGVAGVAIEKNEISQMEHMLGELKKELWNTEVVDVTNIVFHMSDIRSANTNFNSNYEIFKSRDNIRRVFSGIANIIEQTNMTVFGTMINLTNISELYKTEGSSFYIGDGICMEKIINNFVCFLKHNGGKGKITFESRSDRTGNVADRKLQKQFYKIITHGTAIYKAYEIQDVITDIRFIKKQENSAGLQIADFVPTHFMLNFSGKPQHKINLYKVLKRHRYSGFKTKGGMYSKKFGVTYIK